MKESNLEKIWNNRNKILEGIKNSIFVKESVEIIANDRLEICKNCPSDKFDTVGDSCMVKGTQPCCAFCGCSLHLKLRSLSSGCDLNHWTPVLTEEEDMYHNLLNTEENDKV